MKAIISFSIRYAKNNYKKKILKAVKGLPEEATLDDAIEKLIFIRKIERGIQQHHSEEGVSQDEMEKRFNVSWQE